MITPTQSVPTSQAQERVVTNEAFRLLPFFVLLSERMSNRRHVVPPTILGVVLLGSVVATPRGGRTRAAGEGGIAKNRQMCTNKWKLYRQKHLPLCEQRIYFSQSQRQLPLCRE